MITKLLATIIIATNLISLKTTSNEPQSIQMQQNYEFPSIEDEVQDSFISGFEQPVVDASLLDTNNLPYNMVNYNVQTKTRSFENFNTSSYPRRNPTTQVTPLSFSVNQSEEISNDNEVLFENGLVFPEEYVKPISNSGVSPLSIIGDDTRTEVSNPKEYPYKATAKLVMTYFNIYDNVKNKYVTRYSVGTGFLEGPNLLVAAGHCAYSDKSSSYTVNGVTYTEYEDNLVNPRFPDKIEVFLASSGSADENTSYQYYATALVINIDLDYYLDPTFDHDWAAIELDRNIGNQIGLWYGKIGNWYEQNYDVYSWGYPGDKPGTMWETHGKLIQNSTYRYTYDFDTVGGQSGSPVFMTTSDGRTYVCGIHTSGGSTANGGTKFNTFIFHYLNSYVTSHNYEHLAVTVSPSDYGFADAYPTTITTKQHQMANGFSFTTTRYRTGFIQGEYIVMSPFRKNITKAYIKYDFNDPVSKIEVDLTHWRELSTEWTYSSNCTAVIRTGQTVLLDLLSSSTNLPTDRTQPTTYTIVFPSPVYTFEFYMESKIISTNESNRGRLCIGDLDIYTTEGI